MYSISNLFLIVAFVVALGEQAQPLPADVAKLEAAVAAMQQQQIQQIQQHPAEPKAAVAALQQQHPAEPTAHADAKAAVHPKAEAVTVPKLDAAAKADAVLPVVPKVGKELVPPPPPAVPKIPEVPQLDAAKAAEPAQAALAELAEPAGPAKLASETPQEEAPVLPASEIEIHHDALQQGAMDQSASLTLVPLVAALLSFAGLIAYTLKTFCKMCRQGKNEKGRSAPAKVSTKALSLSEDLDFDDLENALGMPPSPSSTAASTPVSRKLVQSSQESSQGAECGWANDLDSDAGWGDAAWGDGGWDDIADCEGAEVDADVFEAPMAVPRQAKAAVSAKGKAD